MLFLKRIQADNLRLVILRYDWTNGTAYTAYSETTDMSGKAYYVMTPEYNVYKCMGSNGQSRIMPTGRSTNVITLSDGYKWKYVYTVPEDYLGFITLEYIPVFIGSADFPDQHLIERNSKPGSLDSVSLTASISPAFNKSFTNARFCKTMPTFFADTGFTANVSGSTHISFDVSGEVSVEPGNSYWNNYGIQVVDGTGIGQYFRIINSYKGGNAGVSYHYASIYPAISRSLVDSVSMIKIVPYVSVDGDGQDAVVVPTMNSAKKISGLSILRAGTNYTYAKPRIVTESDSVSIGSQVTALNDSITTSLSIPIGHGANAIKELGSSDMMIIVDVDGIETGKISSRNDYRQFGIVKNPYLYGGTTLAGAEDQLSLKALIRKEPSKTDQYTINTFVPGNYIMGKETRATARILDAERVPGSRFHRLYLGDVSGNFRFSDPSSTKTRVYFDSTYSPASPLATGDSAYQYQSNAGLTLTANGTIVSFDMNEKTILLNTTYGSFQSDYDLSFGVGSSLASSKIVDVDEDFGEMLRQVTIGATSGSQFLEFAGNENFGRLASTEFVPVPVDNYGEYRTTTRLGLSIASGSFSDKILGGSNALDGTIRQINSTNAKLVTGTVVDFVVVGGVGITGTLHLNNITGQFNTTDSLTYIQSGSTAETVLTGVSISSIDNSEISIGSGELLYIENVRPIERNTEQSEEFKIVIGF
jgi:hypothetical protein